MLSTIRSKLSLSSSYEAEGNFLSTLKFQSCLGLGGFGIVLQTFDPLQQPAAVKFVFPSESDEEEKQIIRECQLASTSDHSNIVRILNVAEKQLNVSHIEKIFKNLSKKDERSLSFRDMYLATEAKRYKTVECICIQMELCGENLRKWLNQRHDKTEEKVQRLQVGICYGIVTGLEYLHGQKIIHRDLKPENIMFSANGFQHPVKIGDFGLCRTLHSNPESQTGSLTSRTGTPEYMAPEIFSNAYTLQADIYSLGLVIWEVIQLIKFQERRALFDGLVNDKDEGVVPEIFSVMREAIINLTKKKTTEKVKGLDEVIRAIDDAYQTLSFDEFANTRQEVATRRAEGVVHLDERDGIEIKKILYNY